MPSVWFIGAAGERTITTAMWAQRGITGVAETTWNEDNGWSIPHTDLTAGQLTLLGQYTDFATNQADGPRQYYGTAGSPAMIYQPVSDLTSQELANVGEYMAIDVHAFASLSIHAKGGAAGSSALQATFECSLDSTDGINGTWFAIQGGRSDSPTVTLVTGSTTLAAGVGNAYSWEFSVNAIKWMRVRCTARTSGSVIFTALGSAFAGENIPAIQAHPVTVTPSGTNYVLTTAASTNLTAVRNAACYLMEIVFSNPTATPAFAKLYNKATAPVVATDVPLMTVPVPANSCVPINFGQVGKRFAAGIGLAVTGAIAATDATAAVAGIQISATYV